MGNSIGSLSPSAEALFTLWIVGWVLLAWAIVIGSVVSVQLVRAVASRRRPALIETVLVGATAAVVASVLGTHPLVGSGGDAG